MRHAPVALRFLFFPFLCENIDRWRSLRWFLRENRPTGRLAVAAILFVVSECVQFKCALWEVFAVRSACSVVTERWSNMSSFTSIDFRGVPRGRCKNKECDCPEFSRDTAPTNSTIPAGWCAYCGHSLPCMVAWSIKVSKSFPNFLIIRFRAILQTAVFLVYSVDIPIDKRTFLSGQATYAELGRAVDRE